MNIGHGVVNMPAVYSMSCVRKNIEEHKRANSYTLTTFKSAKEEDCQSLVIDSCLMMQYIKTASYTNAQLLSQQKC
jgi:hypothetical protein